MEQMRMEEVSQYNQRRYEKLWMNGLCENCWLFIKDIVGGVW